MRKSLTLKTLLRSPLKTIMTLSLIAAASFALFSRITDYAVTTRETTRAESFYSGVAALDNTVPDVESTAEVGDSSMVAVINDTEDKPWPTDEQIEEFSSLPGVTLADTRYMTAGVVEGCRRLIDNDYSFYRRSSFVIEGTYIGYDRVEGTEDFIDLAFDDVTVLAGDLKLDLEEPTIIRTSAIEDHVFYENPFPLEFFEKLDKGSRCLVMGADYGVAGPELAYNEGEEVFRVLDGLTDRYLETEAFSFHKGMIEAINQRVYTYDIVYTSDMRSIPRFNERNMVITEGRPLMAEDTDACVVNTLFMETYNLSIGDRVSIELGDKLFRQSPLWGAQARNGESISNFVDTAELVIVGAYQFVDDVSMRISEGDWSYTPSTIFVPSSLLPVEVPADHEISAGEFSVLIENARDIEAFQEAAEPLVTEMDVVMRFTDGGWLSMKDSFETGSRTAFLTTVLYLAGAALALLLAVYLYIGRNKKTYAIMRALGVPGGMVRNSIALPLGVLSALAIPAGGITGILYASNAVTGALEGMMAGAQDGHVVNASLPIGTIILCLLCELIFTSFITSFFLRKMKKTPPLELLQGDVIRVGIDTKAIPAAAGPDAISARREIEPSPVAHDKMLPCGKYGALRHVTAYIFRHMRRGVGKTAISLILAVVLTTGVGLLVLTRLTYQDVFRKTEVKGRALKFSSSYINPLTKSGLVKDFYYHGGFDVLINSLDLNNSITFTNDFDRYLKDTLHINDYTVTYAGGLDASSFAGSGALCLLGSEVAKAHGVRPGDKIALFAKKLYSFLPEIYDNEEDILAAVEWGNTMYTVAGIIDSDDAGIGYGVIAAANSAAEDVYEQSFPLDYSEFTLADNERLGDLEDLLGGEIKRGRQYAPSASFYIDTAALDNIKRVRDLLVLLFPVAVTAAVLMGLFGPGLIIMQSAKEAALLRILGVTKKRARCMLMFEQVVLCAVGISLAAGVLVLYNSGLFARSAGTLAVCGALYLSGCVCGAFGASLQVTRRRILELIQVKE